MTRRIRNLLGLLALASTALALTAASASAAPQLGVELRSDNNETQAVKVYATAGEFVLSFGEGGPGVSETADIPATATAAQVQAALNAISNISADGGSVIVDGGPGNALASNPYRVYFAAGPLANRDLPQLVAISGSTPLSGGKASPGGNTSKVDVLTVDNGFTINHADERVEFTVGVKNVAPPAGAPSVGAPLVCITSSDYPDWWFDEFVRYHFEFRWLRDGAPLGPWSAADTVIGTGEKFEKTTYISRYTVQPADAGGAIQCLVKGTNASETGSAETFSQPALVVNPQPAVAPPTPNDPTSFSRRPIISGTADEAGKKLKCTAPTDGWSASNAISPIAWSFEWLRDGEPASGTVTPLSATESEYELTAEDVTAPAAPAVFQCIATATNAGGHSTVVDSPVRDTQSPAPEFERFATPQPTGLPTAENASNTLIDGVVLEVELPGGEETSAFKTTPADWNCDKLPASGAQPARAVCSPLGLLSPQRSYPPLEVTAAMGADAPDLATAKATVSGGGSPSADDEISFPIAPALPFGLTKFTAQVLDEADNDYTQAGGHAFKGFSELSVSLKRPLTTSGLTEQWEPTGQLRQALVELPPGVVGNPLAPPALCPSVEELRVGKCPAASTVGAIYLNLPDVQALYLIRAIKPDRGLPAQLAFLDSLGNAYVFTAGLRPEDGYAVNLELASAPEVGFRGSVVTLCGFGVKVVGGAGFAGCKEKDDPTANPKAFITNPTRCGVALSTRIKVSAWGDPAVVEGPPFANPPVTGCEAVPFEPSMKVTPTTNRADSPTGLDAELNIPTEGLEKAIGCHERQGDDTSPLAPECLSEANLRDVEVTLPEGLTVNPAGANGLAACSEAEVGISHSGVPNDDPVSCPDASKIGSVQVSTPLLEKPLDGAVYQAQQDANPFGSTLAIYLVAELAERGILVKLAGKVELDPQTGQITSTFKDNPQVPFESFELHFFGGATAPLRTPATCGEYSTTSVLTPWSGGSPVTDVDTVAIDQGAGGGACANSPAEQPHAPSFDAGTISPISKAFSPFVLHLRREDGSQTFSALNVTLPPGMTGKLAGTALCSDGALAAAASKAGRDEQANPSCPLDSHVGEVYVAAGAGPHPYNAKGDAYLAGPYKGAPVSIATVAPAVAGPFDLGTVVVRAPVFIDPKTAQLSTVTDPIPAILDGIVLDVRSVDVVMDRPEFTLTGTSCDPSSVEGSVTSTLNQLAALTSRFQLSDCTRLPFKPKMSLRLRGGTRRGAHPALTIALAPRPGDANIASLSVALPRSEFLENAHIRTVCTRPDFAADNCPKGAIYGEATVTTPLLDYPLAGNVYLRSSDNLLPDVVPDLRGPSYQPIRLESAGRTDSIGGGIRNTIDFVPDAPFTKALVQLQGGNKGLLVNSRNICDRVYRATVRYTAHNGKTHTARPKLRAKCAKKGKRKKAKRSSHSRAKRLPHRSAVR